ncbi:hypothetical protein Clacol_009740 [Clathrus columnatus]|uniref:Enoyl reductase (ER) domain-containing protein n=1 Tax=Clathrus columnatus TaxID=1419009 RepID=A0AAV5ANW2_9AGAM|nr:hypothetical protein Clacol_009740 [Clathrus columnatus]
MRAARLHGNKDIRVDSIPEPEVGLGEVKLKIGWCGICGSDLHEYLEGPITSPKTPHPTTGEMVPIVMGHEFSGTIVAVGKGVDPNAYPVGKKVVVFVSRKGGGLSEYISVDVKCVHLLPDHISLEIGACIEPLSVAWYAVKRANFKPEDKCLVIGSGPIGLFVVKVLKARGCKWVAVSEPATARRENSLKFGADAAYDPRSVDVVSEIKKQTNGLGVDISFECAGSAPGLDSAIAATKARGTIMNVAMWGSRPNVNMMNIFYGERILTSICCYVGVHPEVIEAVADGRLSGVDQLITSRISLEDVVKDGIEKLITDKDNQIKILVRPGPPNSKI